MRDAPDEINVGNDTKGIIAAVVVTRNRLDHVKKTVERLLSAPVNHVVIVDNCSSDGTREWLGDQTDKRLLVDLSETNLGGAGGFARGIDLAIERLDADWLLLMDDDARPQPGAIETFRKTDLTGWDVISTAVYYPTGEICEMNRPSWNPFWSLRVFLTTLRQGGRVGFHVTDDAYNPGSMTEIDVGSFVGMFVSRKAVDTTGLPDARLFIYGDDVSYSLAMRKAGARIGFAADIKYEHDCGTRPLHDEKRVTPLWKAYYLSRNAVIVYRRVAGIWFWPLFPVLMIRWALRSRIYKEEAHAFRRLVRIAVQDGLTERYDRTHEEIEALSREL